MRLFLDANVIFSAAYRESGSTRIFFRLAQAALCELVSSPYAIEEVRRNVAGKYPDRLEDLRLIQAFMRVVPEATPDWVAACKRLGLPPKDAPILAAAIQARTDILVTGDRKDFGQLFGKTIEGVTVLPPPDALERVLSD